MYTHDMIVSSRHSVRHFSLGSSCFNFTRIKHFHNSNHMFFHPQKIFMQGDMTKQ